MTRLWPISNTWQAYVGAHLAAMVAFSLPFVSPDALLEDLPLIRHTGDNRQEQFSVALFQYVSFVYIALVFLTALRLRPYCSEAIAQKESRHRCYHSAFVKILPLEALLGVTATSLLAGATVTFYDGRHGEGLAIPLFFFQTLPLTLMVLITARACRAGVVSLRAFVLVLALLLLLPSQFLQDWLILLLLLGSFPAMLGWTYVIVRRVVAAGNWCMGER
jgi:hypothetical protein